MAELVEARVDSIRWCDLCGQPATHDGKTRMGPWAYMCDSCFGEFGVGLGTGRGQRLVAG